jgi:hypothetical protein
MITGLLLAISLSISLTSLAIIITGSTGILRENLATGAAIGTSQAVSYAGLILIISTIITFFLVTIIKQKY